MKIGIYGLGRFGSFYTDLLRNHFEIKVYSRNPKRETPAGVKRVSEDELLSQPVVILCVAISAMKEVLQRIGPRLAAGSLVMDTCSVKALPVEWMVQTLPESVQILGTHPMFGPDSALAGVEDLPIILCPARIEKQNLDTWSSFFAKIGLKVMVMDAHNHDREAATTQGITHYLGRVLAELELVDSEIATLGYRKLLDIIDQTCNDSWQLFFDLQLYNPYTKAIRDNLSRSLKNIDNKLDIAVRR
ncbi:MAG: prephenate dehydrogenase/arogenate dehydrogenase family protein [Spirochaeta sp.]|nr:prephenate dehydrogenase/arogenate dehydrogenase family protein [Spirochaeta sp.]